MVRVKLKVYFFRFMPGVRFSTSPCSFGVLRMRPDGRSAGNRLYISITETGSRENRVIRR